MEKKTMFTYSWHIDDSETNITAMRVYGVDENNENICIRINNFTPFVYIELPDHILWTDSKAQLVGDKIDKMMGNEHKPLKKCLQNKHRLYYAYLDKNKKRSKFPYLFCQFSNKEDIKKFSYKIKLPINIIGIGYIKLKMHEQDASPILQFTSLQNIPTAGWIEFRGKKVSENDKITLCQHEYTVQWKNAKPSKINKVSDPLLMSFDIEVNSSNPSAMPKSEKPGDKIFQISCILSRSSGEYKKYLLTLGDPDQEITGNDTNIIKFNNEAELLVGYTDFIKKHNPNIIVGYNILGFDIPYMIDRAKMNMCISEFDQQGFNKYSHSKEKIIKWSSSAYKNQEFLFLDAEGRLFVDLLPLIKRDYKMDNYKLKTVASFFIGQTKDDLSPQGIFKCYRIGIKKQDGIYQPKARKAMGICGKYCVQDSVLVAKLFNKLQTWIGLCEMATTCNVPIFFLYTSGQQIRVYSQLYKFCMFKNFVVEKDGYIPKDDEHFQGATVFDPIPGVYDKVLPFDFASLYPTTIIAYNIDYSTLVIDPNIPDKDCHVIDWTEHCGCSHDTSIRKTKPKYVLCGHKNYRFLKEPKGVMPTVLQNLLDARKNTRKEIKDLKKRIETEKLTDPEIKEINTLINVLDKRQAAYKVSANSMYGAMGVTRGYLPFMPGAMCTTAMGRHNINIVAKTIPEKYGGKLIYGDTDSNYIVFPHLETAAENWDHAIYVADEISKLFPPPIKLEFEMEIYWRFLILTKKRYMYKKCGRDGIVEEKIGKKGVLLARRDNSAFIRNLYSTVIMMIFNKEDRDNIIYTIILDLNRLCSGFFPISDFTVTKSIGSDGGLIVTPFINEKGKKKGKIGDYTVPILSPDNTIEGKKERERQFKLKNCNNAKDYYLKCLPAQVQLAAKMRLRGQRVDAGSRLEYVITDYSGHIAKQYEKLEDFTYFTKHSNIIKLDFLYYLKLLTNPLDQCLNIVYDKEDSTYTHSFIKDFVLNQYKYRYRTRFKMLNELKSLFKPKLSICSCKKLCKCNTTKPQQQSIKK